MSDDQNTPADGQESSIPATDSPEFDAALEASMRQDFGGHNDVHIQPQPEETAPEAAVPPPSDEGGAQVEPSQRPAPEPAGEPEPTERESRSLAVLARRERELRLQEAELKAAKSQVEEFSSIRDLASSNPYAALEKLGITPDRLINADPPKAKDPADAVREDLEQYKRQQAAEKAQQAQVGQQAQIENFKGQLGVAITERASEYKGLAAVDDGAEMVWEAMVERNKIGESVEFEEVAKDVDARLLTFYGKLHSVYGNGQQQATQSEPKPAAPATQQPTPTQHQTLTNRAETSPTQPKRKGFSEEEVEDRMNDVLKQFGYSV